LQFAPLRQVLDGRVKRRLRRNGLSEEINIIEWDKRNAAKERKSEVERLRNEVATRDLEIQSLRDEQDIASQIEGESGGSVTTNTRLSARVQELEQEIRELKAELQRKESDTEEDPNWTMAAGDPFGFDDDDDHMITSYDDDFRESMMNDEMITTPTRLNTSFPSPPSTVPNTPCKSASSMNAGIQASLPVPDPENEVLKIKLESLQSEISKLTAAIAFNDDNQARLAQKLSDFIPTDESHDRSTLDSALDTVLTQLALSQSHALERTAAFSALSTEITNLGFSCSGPEKTLETIASQFRQARLDLEYLTPGEVVEGFENDKLLEMLVSRIKVLVQKVKERDDSIDQYHEQELLLRQQINTRVTVMDEMRKELILANTAVCDLREEIKEKDVGNERLKEALEGYRQEVSGLEKLIERIEHESRESTTSLTCELNSAQEKLQDELLQHDTMKADCEGKEILISELEKRLNSALQAEAEFQAQLSTLASSHDSVVTGKDAKIEQLKSSAQEREKEHGDALALCDARVSELREEIERVNTSLKTAHSTILKLRKENSELAACIQGKEVLINSTTQVMRDQLNQLAPITQTGEGYTNGDVSVLGPRREGSLIEGGSITGLGLGVVREKPRMMDGSLARRRSGSGKKRRRYDSGLGFVGEEDEGVMSSDL
jgi:chromosome segregation ATPase